MLKVTKLSTSVGGAVKTANYYKTHDNKLDAISPNKELFKKDELDSLSQDKGYSEYVLADKDIDTAKYSEWGGKLAEEFDLAGKSVSIFDLTNALNGKIGGQQIQLGVNKNRKMGDDFTFSASKSMSILAFIEGDKRLVDIHKNAVKEAMVEVVKNVPEIRVYQGRDNKGNPILENVATDKVMYAMETHKVSREGDPQIHDHVILVNATLDNNGKARAMTIDKLYDDKLNTYFGSIYQHSCRKAVEELGYETYSVGSHGQFNIKGISQDNLDYFSKRRAEILKEQDKFKASNPNTRDKIAKYSRNPKAHLNKEQISQIWNFGKDQFDNSALVKASYDKLAKVQQERDYKTTTQEKAPEISKENHTYQSNNTTRQDNQGVKVTAEQAIQRSISNIGRYTTKLTHIKILDKALSDFATDNKLTHHDLKIALDKLDKNHLVPLDKHGTVFSTKEMIVKEKAINDNIKNLSNSFQTKLLEAPIDNNISNLNKGVALEVLDSKNQVNLLSVDGSSKDTVEYITKALNSNDKSVHILTSNKENQIHDIETKSVEKDTSIFSIFKGLIFGKQEKNSIDNQIDTIGGFTYKINNGEALAKSELLIVDQADRLSIDDTIAITKQAKVSGTKLIFLNQQDGLSSNRAGNVIDTLKQSNIPQFLWQKEHDIEKQLHIHEDKNYLSLTSKLYSSFTVAERKEIQIITSHTDKEKLNDTIRYNLRRDGELEDAKSIKATKDIKLSKEHAVAAKNYPIGSNIAFFKNKTAYNYTITGHDLDNNKVITTDRNGKEASFSPEQQEIKSRPRITKEVDFNYAVGEIIRVDKGSKNGLSIGEYEVSKIEKNRTELINKQTGETRMFKDDIIERANLSHTYAKTIDNISYENDKNLVASFMPFSLKKELANELTNKTKESLTIITTDATIANKAMQKSGIKDSAITTTIDSASLKKEQIKDVYADLTNALDKLNNTYNKSNIAKAVDHAVDSINQKEATFDIRDVFDIATQYAKNELSEIISHKDVQSTLDKMVETGELITSDSTSRFTTKTSLDQEKRILEIAQSSQNSMKPIATKQDVLDHFKYLESKERPMVLSKGQKDAIEMICTTTDRFTAVQGFAGTGKSTMLEQAQAVKDKSTIINTVQEIMAKADDKVEFIGLAPTIKATAELNNKGIKSQTMQSFLADEVSFGSHPKDTAKNDNYANKLILLDEFSMASNKDILTFGEIVNNNGAKSVYLGDIRQLGSQESGSPIELMMRKGVIKVTQMNDIKRQQAKPYLNAIKSLVNGNVSEAFENLSLQNAKGTYYEGKPSIVDTSKERKEEIETILQDENLKPQDKREAIVGLAIGQVTDEYLSRPQDIRDKTLIVTNSHRDRDIMHDNIRSGLGLGGDIYVDRLRAKNLTTAEMRELEYEVETFDKDGDSVMEIVPRYEKGMIFQQGNDKFANIVDVNMDERSITLKDSDTHQEYKLYPSKVNHDFNTLYEVHSSGISSGDLLMMKSDDKANNIKKNDRVIVNDIKDGFIYAKNDEKEIRLDTNNPQHMVMEYGYTNTTMSSQGMTVESVMPFAKSHSPLNSLNSLYVQLSRGQVHATLFTDNLEEMKKGISATDKSIAHDVIEKVNKLSLTKLKLDSISQAKQQNGDIAKKSESITSKDVDSNKQYKSTGVLSQLPDEILKDPQYLDHNNKFNIKSYGNEISKDLVKYTESIAQQYLGEPNKKESNHHVMAFGSSGAMKVTLTGEHRGKWKDWSDNNQHGDLITLIKEQGNLSYTEAVIEASKIIGQPTNFSIKETNNSKELSNATTATKSRSYDYGQRIWQESLPIKGTLAEKYLEHRGIENTNLTGLRFHHSVYTKESENNFQPALVASFTNKDRNINAIEVIYLDKETGLKAQDFHTGKKTYGSKNGSAVDLSPYNQDTKISLIAEGVITGLSVKEAYPDEHVIAVGGKENISNISHDILNDNVVICADNDGKDISQDSSLNNVIQSLEDAGKTVSIVSPKEIENMQKVDFNDTLNHQGLGEVKNQIDEAISKLHDNNIDRISADTDDKILPHLDVQELAKELNMSGKELVDYLINDNLGSDSEIEDLLNSHDIDINEIENIVENSGNEMLNKIQDRDLEI